MYTHTHIDTIVYIYIYIYKIKICIHEYDIYRLNDIQIQHPCIYTCYKWLFTSPFPTKSSGDLGKFMAWAGRIGRDDGARDRGVKHRGGNEWGNGWGSSGWSWVQSLVGYYPSSLELKKESKFGWLINVVEIFPNKVEQSWRPFSMACLKGKGWTCAYEKERLAVSRMLKILNPKLLFFGVVVISFSINLKIQYGDFWNFYGFTIAWAQRNTWSIYSCQRWPGQYHALLAGGSWTGDHSALSLLPRHGV